MYPNKQNELQVQENSLVNLAGATYTEVAGYCADAKNLAFTEPGEVGLGMLPFEDCKKSCDDTPNCKAFLASVNTGKCYNYNFDYAVTGAGGPGNHKCNVKNTNWVEK